LKNEMKSKIQKFMRGNTSKDELDLNKDDEPRGLVFKIQKLVLELEVREEEGTSRIVK
jgi:hypothetical protein